MKMIAFCLTMVMIGIMAKMLTQIVLGLYEVITYSKQINRRKKANKNTFNPRLN